MLKLTVRRYLNKCQVRIALPNHISTFQIVLQRRESQYRAVCKARENHQRQSSELQKLQGVVDEAPKQTEKRMKQQVVVNELNVIKAEAEEELAHMDETIKTEWQRWLSYASTLHRRILTAWAHLRATQYQKTATAWRNAADTTQK